MKRLLLLVTLITISVTAARPPLSADVEVVVTASRTEEESKTVPAQVQVIPEEEIAPQETLLDILPLLPNLTLQESSPGKAYLTMGGFGNNGFGRVLILRNGIPQNRPDMAASPRLGLPLAQIERIEIIQGGYSSRYGDQAVAGVINIITRKPEPELAIHLSSTVDNRLSNSQSISLSYGQEPWAVQLDAVSRHHFPSRKRSRYGSTSLNMTAFLELAPWTSSLEAYCTPSFYQLPGGLTREEYKDNPNQAINLKDKTEETQYGASLITKLNTGPWKASLPLSFDAAEARNDMASSFSFTTSRLLSLSGGLQGSRQFFWGESWEIQPQLGFDCRGDVLQVKRYPTQERKNPTLRALLQRQTLAPWGRLRANREDTLILEGGGRWEYTWLRGSSREEKSLGKDSHIPWAGDGGITVLPLSFLRIYTRISRIFRYPALDEQASYYGFGTDTVYSGINPERGLNLSGGIGFSKAGFEASVSPFVLWMRDEIVYDSSLMKNVNAGRTRRMGGTLQASASRGPVQVNAGWTHTHARNKEEKVIPLVPANKVTGGGSLQLPVNLTLSSSLRWISSFYQGGDDENNLDPVRGRFQWSASLEASPREGLILFLRGKNLLNDRTPSRVYYSSWYPTPGRTIEAGASWSY